VVIDVKLGKNGELSEAVAEQLEHYVRHIGDEAPQAHARCYEKTYAQKRRLRPIAGAGMPDEIEIDGSEVEGLVVVGGYTPEAMAQVERLRASHPELRVYVFRNSLVDEGGGLVGS
jgi:plasmid stabilization system protein ParE